MAIKVAFGPIRNSDGIPFTSFAVDDVREEFERLRALGVAFTQEPATMGPVTTAVFPVKSIMSGV